MNTLPKYPKIKRLGDPETMDLLEDGTEVLVQEKLDGANFRFTLAENVDGVDDDRDLVFGSRNVVWKNEKDVDKNFTHAVEHVREQFHHDFYRDWKEDPEFEDGVVFYGESMHPHTIEYEWDEVPNFLGFDVWSVSEQRFLEPFLVKNVFLDVGLSPAPICGTHSAEKIDAEFEIPDSHYRDGIAEGVVFKNVNNGTYAKLRSDEFLEKHGSNRAKNDDITDVNKLVATYVTNPRIEKMALKLVDEGEYDGLQMEMMEDLPMAVLQDVFEEESWDILTENWEIDLGDLRSRASKKCARTLKEVMTKRAMNDVSDSSEGRSGTTSDESDGVSDTETVVTYA